ncbi:pancreatic progenitor cell differentiation and proliferation factor [Crotalus adamanteus]|uniref:Pancreatic progenitor cell differentiation and proliferation factor n=1 Tax=Crotalus adamanteus TaxID=8729 RepID=A0AAW1BT35_CROAD
MVSLSSWHHAQRDHVLLPHRCPHGGVRSRPDSCRSSLTPTRPPPPEAAPYLRRTKAGLRRSPSGRRRARSARGAEARSSRGGCSAALSEEGASPVVSSRRDSAGRSTKTPRIYNSRKKEDQETWQQSRPVAPLWQPTTTTEDAWVPPPVTAPVEVLSTLEKSSRTIQVFPSLTLDIVMTTVSESPENSGTFQVANGMITCDLAQEVMRKRHASEPSKSHTGPTA